MSRKTQKTHPSFYADDYATLSALFNQDYTSLHEYMMNRWERNYAAIYHLNLMGQKAHPTRIELIREQMRKSKEIMAGDQKMFDEYRRTWETKESDKDIIARHTRIYNQGVELFAAI